MRFIASALMVPSKEGTIFFLGKRHSDCYKQIKEFNLPISVLRSDIIQGFLIEDNRDIRFVNRSEGAEIAKALGYKIQHSDCLYSEDLW